MDFKIEQFVPAFLLNDKNGYALAKAIEAAVQKMNATVEQGIAMVTDVAAMPEWRLDELAWETDCLYDYDADIEAKRQWISKAIAMSKIDGTPEAVAAFAKSYFPNVEVEEWWTYGGDPGHFRVGIVDGYKDADVELIMKSMIKAKNVRSVLDEVVPYSHTDVGVETVIDSVPVAFKKCGVDEL